MSERAPPPNMVCAHVRVTCRQVESASKTTHSGREYSLPYRKLAPRHLPASGAPTLVQLGMHTTWGVDGIHTTFPKKAKEILKIHYFSSISIEKRHYRVYRVCKAPRRAGIRAGMAAPGGFSRQDTPPGPAQLPLRANVWLADAQKEDSEVAEALWSVAEWAVALRFDNLRATVLVLFLLG